MSNTSNEQADQGHKVVEDIDLLLEEGLKVLDLNGERIGEVKRYSTIAGYMMVQQRPFDRAMLYIPFRLIRSIDPREIYLKDTKATIIAHYAGPPQITTVAETSQGRGASAAQVTRYVQVVESGYDNQPVEFHSVDAGDTASQLAIGMIVYDVAGNRLGDISQCDTVRSIIVVQKGKLRPRVLQVPFSAVRSIERDLFTVYLSLPSDVVITEYAVHSASAGEMRGWSHLGDVDLNTGQPAGGGPVPAAGRMASFPDGNNVVGTATDTGVPTGLPFKSKVKREQERRATEAAHPTVDDSTGERLPADDEA